MSVKWVGAIFVIVSCGGFGWYLAAQHRREEGLLRQLLWALDYMECELQYRLTPLPDLCRQVSAQSTGEMKQLWLALTGELEGRLSPEVGGCMRSALRSMQSMPPGIRGNLLRLGNSLGRFDLEGQLKGLESMRCECRRELSAFEQNREPRLRSYRTLGLCAGAALAIILI